MTSDWQILHRAGLPLAGEREGAAPDAARIAQAALRAIAGSPSSRERQALAAFLAAWRDHFPTSFAASFGPDRAQVSAWLDAARGDPGAFIKLRRIAIANLASVL